MGEDSRKKELLNKLRSNLELLGSPLEYATKVLGLAHFGDEEAKKMCLLSIVTTWLPSRYHISCAITGPTMTGKTNLLHALFELVPRSRMLDKAILLGMTPMSLFYEAANRGEKIEEGSIKKYIFNVEHFIVFLGDFALLYLEWKKRYSSRRLFRFLFSAEDEETICHGLKIQYCIRGRPVFVTTLLDEDIRLLDGQKLGRLLMAWVDANWSLKDKVGYIGFILNEDENEERFENGAQLVRSFLSLLPGVKSVSLSHDAIKFLDEFVGPFISKRDVESVILRLIGLSASYELLNYVSSLIREEKEVPEKLDELEVTEKSVRYIWNIGRDTIMMG